MDGSARLAIGCRVSRERGALADSDTGCQQSTWYKHARAVRKSPPCLRCSLGNPPACGHKGNRHLNYEASHRLQRLFASHPFGVAGPGDFVLPNVYPHKSKSICFEFCQQRVTPDAAEMLDARVKAFEFRHFV